MTIRSQNQFSMHLESSALDAPNILIKHGACYSKHVPFVHLNQLRQAPFMDEWGCR